jgi:hypothetical protein
MNEQPRHPAGAAQGRGGQFAPKDKLRAIGQKLKNKKLSAGRSAMMLPIDRNAPDAWQKTQQREKQITAVYDRLQSGSMRRVPGEPERLKKGKMGALTALSDAKNPKVGLVGVKGPDGEYTGFLSFKSGSREIEIETLGTDGSTKGSGKALFRQVLGLAARDGKGMVVAPVEDAIGFYEKMGMRKVSAGALELTADEVKALWNKG